MANIKINYLITDGPSKFDLMVSLFEGKQVEFTQMTEKNYVFKIPARVQSVEREDGSDHSWNLIIFVLPGTDAPLGLNKKYAAYYNSRTRKGTISIN